METQLQVGSPALNRSNPKKKEPFTEDKMLPLCEGAFSVIKLSKLRIYLRNQIGNG